MNKFKVYFTLLFISFALFSCHKDDNGSVAPPRDYTVQYQTDIDSIEGYLKTHYIIKTTVDGQPDITIDSIPTGNPAGLISVWDNKEYPLQLKIVKNDARTTVLTDGRVDDPVDYKLYYLQIKEGGGTHPITIDSTYTTYKGWTLDGKEFDNGSTWATFPALITTDKTVISGYRQFLPLLKDSDTDPTTNPDGTINYGNVGIGVVFIPSGLGYFNSATSTIGAYSPLVFRIRLHTIKERDHDKDHILSKYEDINNDGDFFNDDSDGDKIPDFLDIDDDGDHFMTKNEIQYVDPVDNITKYYSFENIPTCTGGNGKKRHLDTTCHN